MAVNGPSGSSQAFGVYPVQYSSQRDDFGKPLADAIKKLPGVIKDTVKSMPNGQVVFDHAGEFGTFTYLALVEPGADADGPNAGSVTVSQISKDDGKNVLKGIDVGRNWSGSMGAKSGALADQLNRAAEWKLPKLDDIDLLPISSPGDAADQLATKIKSAVPEATIEHKMKNGQVIFTTPAAGYRNYFLARANDAGHIDVTVFTSSGSGDDGSKHRVEKLKRGFQVGGDSTFGMNTIEDRLNRRLPERV
jgi:hypothetical protein